MNFLSDATGAKPNVLNWALLSHLNRNLSRVGLHINETLEKYTICFLMNDKKFLSVDFGAKILLRMY